MQIKEAVKYLKKDYKPDDEIIMAWWDRTMFEDMTDEEWSDAVAVGDDMDWSRTHEDLTHNIREEK